jgi:hypothetical protein
MLVLFIAATTITPGLAMVVIKQPLLLLILSGSVAIRIHTRLLSSR